MTNDNDIKIDYNHNYWYESTNVCKIELEGSYKDKV